MADVRIAKKEVDKMGMNPLEQIEFSVREADDCRAAVDEMTALGRWELVRVNLSGAFENSLYAALVACRLDDNRAPLFQRQALDVARRAETSLYGLPDKTVSPASFCFEAANMLGLLRTRHSTDLIPLKIALADIRPFSNRQLSVLLYERLTGMPPSMDWDRAVAQLAAKKRSKLAAETYSCYGRIMHAAGEGQIELAMKESRNAASLFAKRAADPFYQGGPSIAGGGPSNDFVIDYELAAIQRRYFESAAPGAEVHWWRW